MTTLLSEATVTAIAELGHDGVKFDEDVRPALVAVGLDPIRCEASYSSGENYEAIFIPGARDHIKSSLSALNLGDPGVVDRVLRFTSRIASVYAAGATADHAKVVRLHNARPIDVRLPRTSRRGTRRMEAQQLGRLFGHNRFRLRTSISSLHSR